MAKFGRPGSNEQGAAAEGRRVLSRVGPAGHAFFNEALTGRGATWLTGRRWRDLKAIVDEQRGWSSRRS
jgi:hypothetical protein